jgi:MFS family permease
VVAGYSPLQAGVSLLPMTLILLLFSARSGALAARIGPRLQMTAGPLIGACGVLLMLRIGPDASYPTEVLPAVVVYGLGMTTLVAPLTSTVLAAAPSAHAGAASGVNNAVARAAGLLAVALVPAIAGLTGTVYRDAEVFASGFHMAVWIGAGMLVAGGLLSAVGISNRIEGVETEHHYSCPIAGPQLEAYEPGKMQGTR